MHLLREDSIERAVDAFPDAADIFLTKKISIPCAVSGMTAGTSCNCRATSNG
ncbi:hypothetical protein ACFS07_21375 [Undibacterium arcticum]